MIGKEQIYSMKKGSFLLNASRGTVVGIQSLRPFVTSFHVSIDIEALAEALRSRHLEGAAVDVYPSEPEENTKSWETVLQGCPNTILTPRIFIIIP